MGWFIANFPLEFSLRRIKSSGLKVREDEKGKPMPINLYKNELTSITTTTSFSESEAEGEGEEGERDDNTRGDARFDEEK